MLRSAYRSNGRGWDRTVSSLNRNWIRDYLWQEARDRFVFIFLLFQNDLYTAALQALPHYLDVVSFLPTEKQNHLNADSFIIPNGTQIFESSQRHTDTAQFVRYARNGYFVFSFCSSGEIENTVRDRKTLLSFFFAFYFRHSDDVNRERGNRSTHLKQKGTMNACHNGARERQQTHHPQHNNCKNYFNVTSMENQSTFIRRTL